MCGFCMSSRYVNLFRKSKKYRRNQEQLLLQKIGPCHYTTLVCWFNIFGGCKLSMELWRSRDEGASLLHVLSLLISWPDQAIGKCIASQGRECWLTKTSRYPQLVLSCRTSRLDLIIVGIYTVFKLKLISSTGTSLKGMWRAIWLHGIPPCPDCGKFLPLM